MLVPRRVVDQVGPLDDAYFIYVEEADWCRRIRAAGWRCVFAPQAQIIHLDGGSKSTSQIRSRMYIQLQKSQLIYIRKHVGWAGQVSARGIYVGTAVLRLIVFGALRVARSDEETAAKVRLALATLKYHLLGQEPVS